MQILQKILEFSDFVEIRQLVICTPESQRKMNNIHHNSRNNNNSRYHEVRHSIKRPINQK